MSKDFEWYGDDRTCVVVKPVTAVAVHRNEDNDIVIRQQGTYPEEDSFVVIDRRFLRDVILALEYEEGSYA